MCSVVCTTVTVNIQQIPQCGVYMRELLIVH